MLRLFIAASLFLLPAAAEASARLVGDLPRKEGKALVDLPGLETEYGQVRTSEGTRLRTILTRPVEATGRLAAIMSSQPDAGNASRSSTAGSPRTIRTSPDN